MSEDRWGSDRGLEKKKKIRVGSYGIMGNAARDKYTVKRGEGSPDE